MSELEHTLESLVDKYGLSTVLKNLELICYSKAEHVRSTWQDEPLGRAWSKNGQILEGAYNKLKDTE